MLGRTSENYEGFSAVLEQKQNKTNKKTKNM